jgi:hypothetical protein
VKGLLAGALLLASCVFPPDLGDGNVRCGAGGSCPPDLHCDEGRCYRSGSGPRPDASPRPSDTAGDGGGGAGGNGGSGGSGGGNDLSASLPPDMSKPLDFSIGGKPRDMTGCVPTSCKAHGYNCGTFTDGCGVVLNCYPDDGSSCGQGNSNGSCAGAGEPYKCGKKGDGNGPCVKITACKLPDQCGLIIPNGCDDVIVCPPCQ